ncbi:MAG TPA: hypothetical protein VEW67_03265 [Thermoleophilaceae bacterium]|nr:hypothetical protein [Thermoleophilaceae bacterium]
MTDRRGCTRRTLAAGLATLTAGLTAVSASEATTWSPPFPVSGEERGGAPELASSPARQDAVFVWQRGFDVLARRMAANGTLGVTHRLGWAVEEEDGTGPRATLDRAGDAVVVWHGGDDTLRARRLGAKGELGPSRVLARGLPASRFSPQADVAVDAAGNVTVAWARVATEDIFPKGVRVVGGTVHARRFRANGTLGSPIDLPDGGRSVAPGVVVAPSGRATIAWAQMAGDGEGSNVLAATVDARGIVGSARDVSGGLTWAGVSSGPQIALDGAGNVTFAWLGGPGLSVVARRMAADGALGPVHQLATGGSLDSVRVVSALSGRSTIVWRSLGATAVSIAARQLAPDGAPGPLLDLSGPAPTPVAEADVTDDARGRVTATWTQESAYTTAEAKVRSVQARQVDPDGELGPTARLVSGTSGTLRYPGVAAGSNGVVTAAWATLGRIGSTVSAARFVPRCYRVHVRRAVAHVLKHRQPPHAAGVHLNLVFDRAAALQVGRLVMSYTAPSGRRRSEPLLLTRRIDRTTMNQHLLIGIPSELRAKLRIGQRVNVQVPLRAKTYATGCDFGRRIAIRTSAVVR